MGKLFLHYFLFIALALTATSEGFTQIKSKQNGFWHSADTWDGNRVPQAHEAVEVNHSVVFNNSDTRNANTTINGTLYLDANYMNNGPTTVSGTIVIWNNGWAGGSDFFTYIPKGSRLIFDRQHPYDLTPGQRFWPKNQVPDTVILSLGSVTLNDGSMPVTNMKLRDQLICNAPVQVASNLIIETGGSVAGSPPEYKTNSTLVYKVNGNYDVSNEWRLAGHPNGNGPHHVVVAAHSVVNLVNPAPIHEGKIVKGNLTVEKDATLNMKTPETVSEKEGIFLEVDGNVLVAGHLILGDFYGGDLKLKGDLTFAAGYTFTPNERAIVFEGAEGIQNINTPDHADLILDYIVCGGSKATINGHEVKMNQNLIMLAPQEDTTVKIAAQSVLNLNGFKLSVGQADKTSMINGTLKGSETSKLELIGNGYAGILTFKTGFQKLESLILNRNQDEAAVLGTPLSLYGTAQLNGGILNIGDNDLTFTSGSDYTGGSASSYICAQDGGKVIREYTSQGVKGFTYPVGDLTKPHAEYSPATVELVHLTDDLQVGINLRNERHPGNTTSTNTLNRYWNVQVVNPQSKKYKATVSFSYLDNDVDGSAAQLRTAGFYGGNWYHYNLANTVSKTLSASSIENLEGSYTAGDSFAPLATSPASHFRSAGSGDWTSNATWQASPDSVLWEAATTSPTGAAKSIVIQSDHVVSVTTEIHLANTHIYGRLKLSAGKVNIHTPLTDGISVKGGGFFEIATSHTYANSLGVPKETNIIIFSLRVEPHGTVLLSKPATGAAGTGFESLATASYIRWGHNSKFIWNNGRAFGTSGITYFPAAQEDEIPIFSVGPEVVPDITGAGILTINGIFDVRTSVNFEGATGTRNFRNGITGNGTLTIKQGGSGTQNITGPHAILGGSDLKLVLGKVLNLKTSVTVPKDSVVTIDSNDAFGSVNNSEHLVIDGTFDLSDLTMTNTVGTVTLSGTFRTKRPGGFTGGNHSNAAIPADRTTLSPGSTVELYAEGDQYLKTRSDFVHLIFSGSGEKTITSILEEPSSITIRDNAILDGRSMNIVRDSVINNTNLIMLGNSRLIVTTGGTQPAMRGTYDLQGGTIEFAGTTEKSIRGGEKIKYAHVKVTGSNVQSSTGNIWLQSDGTFTVKNGGRFTTNARAIRGTGDGTASVIVESGGVFRVGNEKGFNGYVPSGPSDFNLSAVHHNINNIVLEPGSTIEYYRSSPELTGDGSQYITNGLVYQNLILSGTGNKTAPPDDLIINGDFSRQGDAVFVHNQGTVLFRGDTPQHIDANGSVFYNMINDNPEKLQINSHLLIKNTLELAETSKMHLSTGDVTIVSDMQSTGRVLAVPQTAEISYASPANSGRFKVERYIPDHPKAWQLLSASSQGGTFRESWQNNQDDTPGRGVWMTRPGGGNGFDASSAAPSVKYYNPASNDYTGVSSTSNILSDHPAYFLFVRGDRTVRGINQDATETTLHTRGKLYAPDNPPPTVTVQPEQFAMLGNPYASPIEFKNLTFSPDTIASYVIWDPLLTRHVSDGGYSEYGLGAYRQIAYVDGERIAAPPLPDNTEYPPLQSGQGFFVFNESSSPLTISFSENAKTNEDQNIFRTGNLTQRRTPRIATNLYVRNSDSRVLMDGTLQLFGADFSAAVNNQDAKKMMNSTENIALPSAKYPLIIERRPHPVEGDTLFYHLTNMARREYALQLSTLSMEESGHDVFFHDAHLQTAQQLQPGANNIEFTVDQNPGSAKRDRFYLTFKKMKPLSLPIQFSNERATVQEGRIDVAWRAANQLSADHYILEHAIDGGRFTALKKIAAALGEVAAYSSTHDEPTAGRHLYRIKAVSKTGETVFSKIISAEMAHQAPSVSIYPNPASRFINISFSRQPHGRYQIRLVNPEGRIVMKETIRHQAAGSRYTVNLPLLTAGMYQLEIVGPDGKIKAEQLMISGQKP